MGKGFENEISLVSNASELIERDIGLGLLHILKNVIPRICVRGKLGGVFRGS